MIHLTVIQTSPRHYVITSSDCIDKYKVKDTSPEAHIQYDTMLEDIVLDNLYAELAREFNLGGMI